MLTQQDLLAIGSLIDTKLEEKLEEKLEQKLDQKLSPIKKSIKKMQNDLTGVIEFFDEEHQALRRRVDRIENILKITKIS